MDGCLQFGTISWLSAEKSIIKDVWHPRLVRENDIIIMDQFLTEHSLTEYQKAKLKSFRLWLQVITLADITDPTGLYIEA